MKIKCLYASFLFALLLFSSETFADVVKADDLIVPGHACVGTDCPTSIIPPDLQFDFGINTLLMQENNTRIRFIDTSAPDVLGQSWRMFANERTNGGRSLFGFEVRSLTEDTVVFSDGTAPLYDCAVATNINVPPPIIGVIPGGEPVISPISQIFTGSGPTYLWDCGTTADYTHKTLFAVDRVVENGAQLGSESEAVANSISLGKTGMLRQLKHVAAGLGASSLLIKKTIDEYSTLPDQKLQIQTMLGQLAVLEMQLEQIEDEVQSDDDSGGSFDIGLTLILTLLMLYRLRRIVKTRSAYRPVN